MNLLEPFQSPIALRVITVAAFTNVACALVGCYLVLRRMSLMGDALSHAVLPGLVVAFLFSGGLNILPLFLGAVLVGLLTTFLIQTLHQFGRVPTDASMGVVFTSLFALGVVMLKRYVAGIHFDAACVYEGSLLQVALDTVEIAGQDVPRGLVTILPVVVLNLSVIVLFWKELKVSSFDSGLATAMGFSATAMHYLLMVLVAVTTVASFEAVGSILVVAMLIVPAATAQLLTDRLVRMLIIACGIAVLSAIVGYWFAHRWNVAPAGAISLAAGACYAIAFCLSPQGGVLSTMLRNFRTSLRIVREDILAMLYRLEELGADRQLNADAARQAVGGGMLGRVGLSGLVRNGRVAVSPAGLSLTDSGRATARTLVRTHRLWETYLVEYLGLPADHVHEPAHRVEHFLDEKIRRELEEAVEHSAQDPHGREIPTGEDRTT